MISIVQLFTRMRRIIFDSYTGTMTVALAKTGINQKCLSTGKEVFALSKPLVASET